jgi:Integrase zinc binding domain
MFRPLVPLPHRRKVFDHLHRPAHPGLRATRRIISSRYVWRGLAREVTAWARECLSCQRGKVHRHVRLRPVHVTVPELGFSHIHVDLVGPLPVAVEVVRSPPPVRHFCKILCCCSNAGLDCKVRRASGHHLGPGEPVHLGPLGQPLQHLGHPAHADHRLPSAVQRPGRAVPPAPQGRPAGPLGPARLDSTPALGAVGTACHPTRGGQHLSRSGCFRHTYCFAWPIFGW